jgi:hypothetical protein
MACSAFVRTTLLTSDIDSRAAFDTPQKAAGAAVAGADGLVIRARSGLSGLDGSRLTAAPKLV